MDALVKNADGLWVTSEGFYGAVPLRRSGVTAEDMAWFAFKTSYTSETIRIEWPVGAPVILLDAEIFDAVVGKHYMRPALDKDADVFNAAVDAHNAASAAHVATDTVRAANEAKRKDKKTGSAVLSNVELPAGAAGVTRATGPAEQQGTTGDTGANGDTGAAPATSWVDMPGQPTMEWELNAAGAPTGQVRPKAS